MSRSKIRHRAAAAFALISVAGLLLLILAATLDLRHRSELKVMDERCNSGARYDAMREAYEAKKPDPCNPAAKEWVP